MQIITLHDMNNHDTKVPQIDSNYGQGVALSFNLYAVNGYNVSIMTSAGHMDITITFPMLV